MKHFSLCVTPLCRNKRGKKKGKLCNKCALRLWRAKYPYKAIYARIRDGAKRRKIGFTLTLAGLTSKIKDTGYLERRGCDPDSLQIDREDNTKGYEDNNIRVVLCIVNARKGVWERTQGRKFGCEIVNGAECPY